MRKPVPIPAKTVLETILEWSQDRPAWQRDALRRIVASGRLDAADIQELVELCKQGRRAKAAGGLKSIPLAKAHLPANPGQGAAVSLVSMADAEGVNNLAPDQTLAFEPKGITVIYGDNGAGKSGYARILKRACRARHAGKIEGNIYASQPPAQPSATITYGVGGMPQPPERWKDGAQPHPVLSAVSVFDSDCAGVHIGEKNEVAFRPFGLDVPDELAGACQAVKDALTAEQKQLEKARNPVFAKPSWKDTTAVGKTIAALRHDTDFQKLEALAALTADEAARLAQLKEDLSKNPAKAAAELILKAENLKRLIVPVNQAEANTADKALAAVGSAVQDARVKREAARVAAAKAFSGEPLEGVGGEVWRALWDSARRYSTQVAYPGQPFPPTEDDARCMLCQQHLGAEARDRMSRFEEFIQRDTERQAREAEVTATQALQALAAAKVATRPLKASLDELALHDVALARGTRRFMAAARLRRYVYTKALNAGQNAVLPDVPAHPAAGIGALEASLRAHAAELQKSATAEERKKLEAELAELTDRELLATILPTIKDELERLRTIYFLDQCLSDTTTNAITKIGNEIADTVVTPKLRDRFQEEIVKLAAARSGWRSCAPAANMAPHSTRCDCSPSPRRRYRTSARARKPALPSPPS